MSGEIEKAKHYHDQATAMEASAMAEDDPARRKQMKAIAEQYYLLHDKFIDLSVMELKVVKLRR